MSNFVLPIKRVSEDEALQGSLVFQPSSRIKALVNNTSKSIGASCNVYALDDSVSSIADGHKWAYHVLSYQGAPSLDFSNLRPRDSKLGSGGKSSGAVSFMQPFDAIVATMRREEKKNGAGIAYLDYSHPDLDDFLALETRAAYKAVYLPMHDTPEAEALLADESLLEKLAKAYNEFRCFLVKRPEPVYAQVLDDLGVHESLKTNLLVNLCTEVEIPHRGFCILGALNLSQFDASNLHMLPNYYRLATHRMLEFMEESLEAADKTELKCASPANRQFGLGVYGLASLLGRLGISYREFAGELKAVFSIAGESADIHKLASISGQFDICSDFVSLLLLGYSEATKIAEGKVRAAFCIQPTVSTAQRSFDSEGYHSSPEIAPVQGLKHTNAVSTIVKSAIKGDKTIDYHPATWTMEDVPYEDYALVSSLWQRVLDSTGLAHRHSHCFYGREFTSEDLRAFYTGELKYRKSLYYRLPYNVNPDSLNKSATWVDVAEGELVDFDVDALLMGGQIKGAISCECEN